MTDPVTRSVEIPGAAVEAVADALAEAGFVDPDDGTVGYWRDGEEIPVWVRPTTLVRVALEAAAALPYLAPAEPWYIARQRHSWEEPNPGQWLCKDCGAEEDDEGNLTVPPLTSYCSAAPAGDGGLREALESRKATLHDWVADWPTNKECEAWTEEIEFIDRTLAAHPAAPAVPQPAGEGRLRAALEALHKPYTDVPGHIICDAEEDNWPCATARLLAEHPIGSAVPQPVNGADLLDALERLAEKWEGMDTPALSAPSNQDWAQGVDSGYGTAASDLRGTLADHAAVPQPVDREALRDRIARALDHGVWDSDTTYYATEGARRRREYALEKADAVLAVLAGEQEQVER